MKEENKQTWFVKLWLDNDHTTYKIIRQFIRSTKTTEELANRIEQFVNDQAPDLPPGMYNDLLGHALRQVDFYGIAKQYKEER